MPFVSHKFFISDQQNVLDLLQEKLKIDRESAHKLIDKNRVKVGGEVFNKKRLISGEIEVVTFEPERSEIEPIFETEDFAVYDKPAGLLVHPNSLSNEPTLLDFVRSRYGSKAQLVHRIDRETSGLVLISKNAKTDSELKELFACNLCSKTYSAVVRGNPPDQLIDLPILQGTKELNSRLSIPKPMSTISHTQGKKSRTLIRNKIYLVDRDISFIEAVPITGRTHQIRLHLAHIGHPILGDMLYGADLATANLYLDGKLTEDEKVERSGAKRLLLHAQKLKFFYKNHFEIASAYSLSGSLSSFLSHASSDRVAVINTANGSQLGIGIGSPPA